MRIFDRVAVVLSLSIVECEKFWISILRICVQRFLVPWLNGPCTSSLLMLLPQANDKTTLVFSDDFELTRVSQ